MTPARTPGDSPDFRHRFAERWRPRLGVGLSVLTCVVLLALFAAGPPDPLWIAGLYDGADFDDLLALSADVALPDRPPVVQGVDRVTELLPLAKPAGATAPFAPAVPPRSPPVS